MVRDGARHKLPETISVVEFGQVAELMHDNVIALFGREE